VSTDCNPQNTILSKSLCTTPESDSLDSAYGSFPQSLEFEDSQEMTEKMGKRSSPTISSSPTDGFKFKRSKDSSDTESSPNAQSKVLPDFIS
jgi:hypothetical protein